MTQATDSLNEQKRLKQSPKQNNCCTNGESTLTDDTVIAEISIFYHSEMLVSEERTKWPAFQMTTLNTIALNLLIGNQVVFPDDRVR